MFSLDSGEVPAVIRMPFGGVEVEAHVEETRKLYPYPRCWNWCQCAGCTNFRAAKHDFYPQGILHLLRCFGIDAHEPMYLTLVSGGQAPRAMARYAGYYGAVGRIEGGNRSGRVFDRGRSFVWAGLKPQRGHPDSFLSRNDYPSPRFLINFSVVVPWLPEYIPLLDSEPDEWSGTQG